jgi:hypothetical protein
MAWERLGEVAPDGLVAARRQAHWAAQVISAAGQTFLAGVPDTSHTAMNWSAGALVGRTVPGARPLRVALRVAELRLELRARGGEVLAELSLAGRTLREACAWTSGAVKAHTRGELVRELVHPGYELEPHAIARGGRFELDPGLGELARWYADAALALGRFARSTPRAGEILCWPHHFDLATLVAIEEDSTGAARRTVGVGLSPGDGFVAEPYAYVNHWPATRREALPALACGEWFRGGWTGAVLRGTALVAAGGARAQERLLERFFDSAHAASRALALEAPLG